MVVTMRARGRGRLVDLRLRLRASWAAIKSSVHFMLRASSKLPPALLAEAVGGPVPIQLLAPAGRQSPGHSEAVTISEVRRAGASDCQGLRGESRLINRKPSGIRWA
jgi:hypothetical protein